MKRLLVLFVTLILGLSLFGSPVVAGGGKNHGDVGQGTVDQGETAEAPGDNAQGNQVDP